MQTVFLGRAPFVAQLLVVLVLLSPGAFAAPAAPPVRYLDWNPTTGEVREWAKVNLAATEDYRIGAAYDGEHLAWYHPKGDGSASYPEGFGSILRFMKGPHGEVNVIHRQEQVVAATFWNGSLYFAEATHADQRVYERMRANVSLWELRLSDRNIVNLNLTFPAPSEVFMDRGMAAWSSSPWSNERRHYLYGLALRHFVWSNVTAKDLGFAKDGVEFLGLVGGHAEFADTNGTHLYRNLSTNQTIELKVDSTSTPVGIEGSNIYWSRTPNQWFVSEGTGPLAELPPLEFTPARPFQMSQGRMLVVDYWNESWGPRPDAGSMPDAGVDKSPITIPSWSVVATLVAGLVVAAAIPKRR